ncbi:MAG: DUF4229 domain-containing protein [Leifsonia sp.]
MKASSWVMYTVLRLLAFFVPFAILMLAGIEGWISALVAAVFGLAFSYIFLRRPREKVASSIYDARHRETPVVHPDDESEDAAIDEAASADRDAVTTNRDAATAADSEGERRP